MLPNHRRAGTRRVGSRDQCIRPLMLRGTAEGIRPHCRFSRLRPKWSLTQAATASLRMPPMAAPRFRVDALCARFWFLFKIAVGVHFGLKQSLNRVGVQSTGYIAERLVKRIRVPLPRLFEEPFMRTIQLLYHLHSPLSAMSP